MKKNFFLVSHTEQITYLWICPAIFESHRETVSWESCNPSTTTVLTWFCSSRLFSDSAPEINVKMPVVFGFKHLKSYDDSFLCDTKRGFSPYFSWTCPVVLHIKWQKDDKLFFLIRPFCLWALHWTSCFIV